MADSFSVSVKGLSDLKKKLDGMVDDMRRKALRSAVAAGARVIVLDARARAPKKTGDLKKSIGSRRDILESRKDYEVRAVSVFKVKGVYGNNARNRQKGRVGKTYLQDPPTFYWKFNELGTVRQPAKPFVEPALSQNIQRVTDAIKDRLADRIAKAAAKP